jgi:threonyl-tRNA synthetase
MTPDQIEAEILGVLRLVDRMYSTFGLGFHLELSTRPAKSIGSDEQWAAATNGLTHALNAYGADFKINEGDGAFYGPKIDIHIKDAIGRTWQCGTIQLDMSLPERFDLSYVGPDNEKHRPVMIHRVIYGSIERFLGILVEHFSGKFPLWLAPVQVVVLPINDDLAPFARELHQQFEEAGLRSSVDDRSESLKKKIREAQLRQIPLIITAGEKERDQNTLSVRTLDGKVRFGIGIDTFMNGAMENIKARKLVLDMFPD